MPEATITVHPRTSSSMPLDANHDGVLSAEEIANAPTVLKGLAMHLAQILARDGIEVEILRNGADALVRLKNGAADFDLVCSDVELPGASGWTVLEWMRTHQPETPFMLISGVPDSSFSREASRRGAVAAFRKPFKMAEVQQTLAGLLPYL